MNLCLSEAGRLWEGFGEFVGRGLSEAQKRACLAAAGLRGETFLTVSWSDLAQSDKELLRQEMENFVFSDVR